MGRVWDWLRRVAADEVKACRERVRPFNLDLWWNELFVFGLIAFVVGIAVNDRGFRLLGLGMAALGFGESRNHVRVAGAAQADGEAPQAPAASYVRSVQPTGVLANSIGILLLAYGLYRVVMT